MSKKESKAKATNTASEVLVDTTPSSEPTAAVEAPTLTINDLTLLAQVVDLASQRGAFKAPELEQVGAAYNKLTVFLRHVANVQEKEAQQNKESVSE